MSPSLAGRVCARLDVGKRMIYRFRHGIIGPLAIFWLTVTVASVVMGAVAWSRFSRSIDASAEAEQFRESIEQLFSVLQDAEASQRGYLRRGMRLIVKPSRTRTAHFLRHSSGSPRPRGTTRRGKRT